MSSSVGADPGLWVGILAGGVGSRFWPASTPSRPKTLLPLGSDRPLVVDTVERALSVTEPSRVRILSGARLVPAFRSVLPQLTEECYWIEPRARGTGPVLAWAAHRIHRSDPAAVLLSLHADHRIGPESAFRSAIRSAVAIARREDALVTLAIAPNRPETGYGYILPGEAIAGGESTKAFRLAKFVEKPGRTAVDRYLASGYLWNTGIFVLPVSRFLDEVRGCAPEIGEHLPLLDRGDELAFFDRVPTVSVDEAVFERSASAAAILAAFDWDDLGNWEALTRSAPPDATGNWRVGDAYAEDSEGSVVWAEDGSVVVFGVRDLVVVRSGGITLVTTRDQSPDLKELLARLPNRLRLGDPAGDAREAARAPERDLDE